jgi:hypothetical protein
MCFHKRRRTTCKVCKGKCKTPECIMKPSREYKGYCFACFVLF